MRYAEVIVDLSAEAIDRVFTYSVPDSLHLEPGFQVAVPFGARVREGFVVRLTDDTDLPPGKIKPILRAVGQESAILPELMELALWMRGRYLCNLVDALRLMLAPGMRRETIAPKTMRVARLMLDAAGVAAYRAAHPRAGKQIEVLERLLKGDTPASEFPQAALAALVKSGAVENVVEERRRTPGALSGAMETDQSLTSWQRAAFDRLRSSLVDGGRFLLHGVTGSGKTEVYIHLIRECLARGRGAIVLVPEIALTPQLAGWFHARFGDTAAVIHSALSRGERYDEWRRIRSGEARVVIGARSAIFAPIENIGVIVVDEEHEHTYQSDRRPCYDARDIARQRAQSNNAVLILGSATPSIETYMRVMPAVRPENRLELLELTRRANGKPLPEAELVDMRQEFAMGNPSIFSTRLAQELDETIRRGEQAMLLINRRGFSTFVSCRACGKAIKCGNCDVSMTWHQQEGILMCHYCGATSPLPEKCPQCGSRAIKHFGAGTEKVEGEVWRRFPGVRTARMDADTTRGKDAHQKLYNSFLRGDAQVLIGTQMIAKGLDFPNVTLVGIISADLSLNLPDYRSSERTFQLITQAAGRAGRAERDGRVVVQTYDPEHYAVRLAAAQDYRAFYRMESQYRKSALYPPFTVIMRIVYSAGTPLEAETAATKAESRLNQFLDTTGIRRDIIQMRALEAPIKVLRGEARWQVFLKMYFKGDTATLSREMQDIASDAPDGVRADFEINPNNLY